MKKHVLAKGRRALLLKGLDGFVRLNAIEQLTGERVYGLVDLAFAARSGGVGTQLAQYPRFTVIPAAGTWLGSADAGLLFGDAGPPGPRPMAARASDDAVTASRSANRSSLGAGTATRAATPTAASPQIPRRRRPVSRPASRADRVIAEPGHLPRPDLLEELQRRNTIGVSVDLEWWRQNTPRRT